MQQDISYSLIKIKTHRLHLTDHSLLSVKPMMNREPVAPCYLLLRLRDKRKLFNDRITTRSLH